MIFTSIDYQFLTLRVTPPAHPVQASAPKCPKIARSWQQMAPKTLQKLRKKLKTQGFIGDKPPTDTPSFDIPNRKSRTGEPELPKFSDTDNPSFKKVVSKVATAAKKSPVSPLIAYDLGKGILSKIMNLRPPSVRGGKAGFRSAGSYTAT